MTLDQLIALDRQSTVALPCFREERVGDWILRFGGGMYGRANSVQPFGDPGMPLPDAVELCETSYFAAGLPSLFRLPHIGDWETLDQELLSRGYEINDDALVQVGPLGDYGADEVDLLEAPTAEWFAAFLIGSGRAIGREAAAERLLHLMPAPRRFATLRTEGRIVSLGIGTICEGTLWLFGIATVPEFRGRGYGREVCHALVGWAKAEGADRGALQVGSKNEPALRLYRNMGFTTVYDYHYRRRVSPRTAGLQTGLTNGAAV
ncbi:GNAT family N-acetyltransferase [Fimbriimonas ginsengisoli]|uniref:GCN5-related N-acetyltransferase n=1 Tax=Fimbriimonas ginsengisoli Gsoil 348 TaxID=661478 RepID=A0A068NMP6_FIMGI|nr:GNAT family N-acetyltransferase [Fimbriimonas ginsengisoli]AIE84657.1 GCN5-related N-acetyltransferase [Fimbriimonas ginsengisoli Gsoil 348]